VVAQCKLQQKLAKYKKVVKIRDCRNKMRQIKSNAGENSKNYQKYSIGSRIKNTSVHISEPSHRSSHHEWTDYGAMVNTMCQVPTIYDKAKNADLSQHKPRKNNTPYEESLTSLKI